MRLVRRAVLALPAALLLRPRGAGAAPDEAIYRAINRAAVEQVLLPGYRRFAEATANLAAQLDALGRSPAEAAPLQAARQGFTEAVLAWEGIEPVRFGPADLFSRYPRIQLWPDPQDSIGRDLALAIAARDASVLEIRANALGKVSVQGLPALERLLFGDAAQARLAAGDAEAGYRAALLRAIGGNLATLARDMLAGWTTGEHPYASTLTEPRAPYASPRDATLELYKLIQATLGRVIDRKLAPALGNSAANAQPKLLEWWRSGLSGQAIQANLAVARDIAAAGFLPALEKLGEAEPGDLLRRAFDQVTATAKAMPLPLEEAIADPMRRPPLERLRHEVAALKALLGQRLPPVLDLPPDVSMPGGG